jgi:hypothetical protein
MTYPNRKTWQANAARDTLQACYPHQRISPLLADHTDAEQRAGIAQGARHARTGLTRIVRLLDGPPGSVRVDDVQDQLRVVHLLLARWKRITDHIDQTALVATDAAVDAEVARRGTDLAWEQELVRRAAIDAGFGAAPWPGPPSEETQ